MKKPAFFLDRDGVLTIEKSYITILEDLEIFPYARECISKIHKAGFYAIVITNQSAVGRGLLTEKELIRMNCFLKKNIGVDEIYYCPHWYDSMGSPSLWNVRCRCRKPGIELIERAVKKYDIELKESYFVGDRESDVATGKNIGIRTVLLETGYGSKSLKKDVKPDFFFNNLEEAVRYLI